MTGNLHRRVRWGLHWGPIEACRECNLIMSNHDAQHELLGPKEARDRNRVRLLQVSVACLVLSESSHMFTVRFTSTLRFMIPAFIPYDTPLEDDEATTSPCRHAAYLWRGTKADFTAGKDATPGGPGKH